MYPFVIHFAVFNQVIEFGVYALFFLIATVTVLVGCTLFAIKRGFEIKKIITVLVVMLVAAVVGARLLNGLINFGEYSTHPEKLFAFSATGFSEYGGILFAAISGYIVCRILKINTLKLADTFIPFLGIGIGIMRIGCFMNGCCFGQETNLPWGVNFPLLSPAHVHQIGEHGNFTDVRAVHPTQLYELAAAILFSVVAFVILRKKLKPGMAFFVFMSGFSVFRLFNSFLRVQPDTFVAPVYFYPALYLSIALFGVYFVIRNKLQLQKVLNIQYS